MADVVVGARRTGPTLIPAGPNGGTERVRWEVGFDWIRVGDVRLDTERHGLRGVRYETEGGEIATVTITLACSSFRTVDSEEGIDG